MSFLDEVLAVTRAVRPRRPASVRAGYEEYHTACPKCGGKDRFVVWDGDSPHFWCRQCGYKGGRHKFIKEYLGVEIPYVPRKVVRMEERPFCFLDFVDFHSKYHELWQQAQANLRDEDVAYMNSFGIDAAHWGIGSVDEGLLIPYYWTRHIPAPDGSTTVVRILRGLKIRKRGGATPKYVAIPGSSTGGPFIDENVNAPDGSRSVLHPEKILWVTEAPKDAMFLNGMGRAAIAYAPQKRWDDYLPRMVEPYERIIYLRDNDEIGAKKRSEESPGLRLARGFKAAVRGTKPVQIVTTKRHKQITDAIHDYLQQGVSIWTLRERANEYLERIEQAPPEFHNSEDWTL
jgi:hypothetical protein